MQRLQASDAYWLADTNSSPVNTKERSRIYLLSGARCEPLSKECIAANSTNCHFFWIQEAKKARK